MAKKVGLSPPPIVLDCYDLLDVFILTLFICEFGKIINEFLLIFTFPKGTNGAGESKILFYFLLRY